MNITRFFKCLLSDKQKWYCILICISLITSKLSIFPFVFNLILFLFL